MTETPITQDVAHPRKEVTSEAFHIKVSLNTLANRADIHIIAL